MISLDELVDLECEYDCCVLKKQRNVINLNGGGSQLDWARFGGAVTARNVVLKKLVVNEDGDTSRPRQAKRMVLVEMTGVATILLRTECELS